MRNFRTQPKPKHWELFFWAGQSLVVGTNTGFVWDHTPKVDKAPLYFRYPDWLQPSFNDAAATMWGKFQKDLTASPQYASTPGEYHQIGPEVAFARQMYKLGHRNIAICKIGQGSHSIETFLRAERQLNAPEGVTDMWTRTKSVVETALSRLRVMGMTAEIAGAVYFQGRANTGNDDLANNYGTHASRLVEDWRTLFDSGSNGNFPVTFVTSPTWTNLDAAATDRLAIVQGHQRATAIYIANCNNVDSDNALGIPLNYPDNTHPDKYGYEQIGVVAANKHNELLII